MKSFFGLFFDFFTGKNQFSRPLFGQIVTFFTPTFVFHGHFLVFFWIFSRVTNKFSRAEIVFLHGEFYSFNGHILQFFFTGIILIFTGTLMGKFSRAVFYFHGHFSRVFQVFSRAFIFFTGTNVHFFHGEKSFFHGEKKNTG